MGQSASLACCCTLQDATKAEGAKDEAGVPQREDTNLSKNSKDSKATTSTASTRATSKASSRSNSQANTRANSRDDKTRANGPKKDETAELAEALIKKSRISQECIEVEKKKSKPHEDSSEAESEDSDDLGEAAVAEVDIAELARVELRNQDFDSLMLIACYAGDKKLVDQCFRHDTISGVADRAGFTAGYHAATSGDLKTLKTLIEHDVHGFYPTYFTDTVTSDNMTPLMIMMRLGHTEVYEYCLSTLDCTLKLKGSRFGTQEEEDPFGYRQPLHVWLEFVPELSHVSQVSKRRPLTLDSRQVDLNRAPTEADYLRARERRLYARNVVRKIVEGYQIRFPPAKKVNAAAPKSAWADDAADGGGAGRRGGKRGAFLMDMSGLAAMVGEAQSVDPEASRVRVLLPPYDVEAILCDGMQSPRGDQSPRSPRLCVSPRNPNAGGSVGSLIVWRCGACQKRQKTLLSETAVVGCDGCKKTNFIRLTNETEACEAADDDESDGDGEMWANEADEFNDEPTVNRYMQMFKRSTMISLGPQRMRQLLRVAKFVKIPKGTILFKKGEDMQTIFVLERGLVNLVTSAEGKTQEREVLVPPKEPKAPHPRVHILDLRAFTIPQDDERSGVHQSTATVKSKDVMCLKFMKEEVQEHCTCGSITDIVRQALATTIINAIPLFKTSFSLDELESLSENLLYQEYQEGHFIVTAGQRFSNILLIQRGTIKVTEGKKSKIIHISADAVDVPPGHFWQSVYVIGVRLLLYDMASPSSVSVESSLDGQKQPCECYVVDLASCEKCMKETGLLHHLQVGTYIMYLIRVILFKKLKQTDPRLKQLIMNSQTTEHWSEEDIIIQGDHGDCMFILMEGTVAIVVDDKEVTKQVADLDNDKVHFFGELSLIDPGPRLATVRVKSSSATTLKVDLVAIRETFGSLSALLEEQGLDTGKALQISKDKVRGGGKERKALEEEMAFVAVRSNATNSGSNKLRVAGPGGVVRDPLAGTKEGIALKAKAKAAAEAKAKAEAKQNKKKAKMPGRA